MRRLVVLAAVLGVGAAAPPAEAAKVFRGETGQSRSIAVRVGDDGRIARVTVGWRAPCSRRGLFVRNETVIRPRRRETTSEVLASAGGYRISQRGGYRGRVRLRISGRHDVRSDGVERWTGRISVRVRVTKNGRFYARCRLRPTVWHAELPVVPVEGEPPAPTSTTTPPPPSGPTEPHRPQPTTWRFEMTGDSGDYITGGRNWVHQPPEDTISGGGGWGGASFSIDTTDGSWSADFTPPPNQRFEAGRTYTDARRYPFNDEHPGLSISGMGRGCNELTGEYTLHEIGFDDRGQLTRFRVSFEQHCEGGSSAARGTLDYTAA